MTDSSRSTGTIQRAADHTRAAQAMVIVFAFLVGSYAAWLGGDYGLGPGSLVGFGIVTAWILVQQPTTRAVAGHGCYLLGGLVLVTPVFLNLPVLTGEHAGISAPMELVLHPGVYVFALVFIILAGLIAGLGVVIDDRVTIRTGSA